MKSMKTYPTSVLFYKARPGAIKVGSFAGLLLGEPGKLQVVWWAPYRNNPPQHKGCTFTLISGVYIHAWYRRTLDTMGRIKDFWCPHYNNKQSKTLSILRHPTPPQMLLTKRLPLRANSCHIAPKFCSPSISTRNHETLPQFLPSPKAQPYNPHPSQDHS